MHHRRGKDFDYLTTRVFLTVRTKIHSFGLLATNPLVFLYINLIFKVVNLRKSEFFKVSF